MSALGDDVAAGAPTLPDASEPWGADVGGWQTDAPAPTVVAVPEARHTAIAGFRRIALALIGGDAAAILLALLAWAASGETFVRPGIDFALMLIVAPVVWVGTFHSFGLYGIRHVSAPEEFRRLISAVPLGILLIMVGSIWVEGSLERRSLAITLTVALVLELIFRRTARWYIGRERASGRLALRTLIVGTNDEADSIAKALAPSVRGFEPIGFVTVGNGEAGRDDVLIVGSLENLPQLIASTSTECVFVASSAVGSRDVYHVSRCCRQAGIEMRLSANTADVLTSRVSVHQVHDLMALAVRSARLTNTQAVVKRCFDLAIASIGAILTLPLMAAIAVAVKLTSPGPVLFRQERVTKDGRTFTLYKFRSMHIEDAEEAGTVIDLTQPFFKMPHDPRMTGVGRSLRAWSLDELPQLWNVIRGDMSLVGPRPLAVEQVAANLDLLDARHEVRAGLTGWWQINGRSDVEAADALKMDLFYIENWSLALDLYVVLKTVGVVLKRRGAY